MLKTSWCNFMLHVAGLFGCATQNYVLLNVAVFAWNKTLVSKIFQMVHHFVVEK